MPTLALLSLFFALFPAPALAFGPAGCGAGECRDCHRLEQAEAAALVAGMANTVEGVGFARVPGLFEVQTVTNGRRFPLLLDFSKKWVLQANVAPTRGKEPPQPPEAGLSGPLGLSVAEGSCGKARPGWADLSSLKDEPSSIVGTREARCKVAMITDPACPWCVKLEAELNEVVRRDPGVAFFVYQSPAQEPLPFARQNGITSTPTLVFPDGRVVPGFRKAEEILRLLPPPGP